MTKKEKNELELYKKLLGHYQKCFNEVFFWVCGKNAYTIASDHWNSTLEATEMIKSNTKRNKQYLSDKEKYRLKHKKCEYCKYHKKCRTPDIPHVPAINWIECKLSNKEVKFPNYKRFCKYYKLGE